MTLSLPLALGFRFMKNDHIKIEEFKPATTGFKELDRDINHAVDAVMIYLNSILRDLIRRELKLHLNLEESDEAS